MEKVSSISKIYDKHFVKKEATPGAVKEDTKKAATPTTKKVVITQPEAKAVVKGTKKSRIMKIRKNGVLRIGGNHIVDKFGFKELQEFTVENPSPAMIIIKGK